MLDLGSKASDDESVIVTDALFPKNLFKSHYDPYLYPAYRQALIKL